MFGLFGGKSFDPEKDIPDLSGKVIIVTGGTHSSLILSHEHKSDAHLKLLQEIPV